MQIDDGHDLPENDGDEEAKRCRLFIILSLNCFCGGTIFPAVLMKSADGFWAICLSQASKSMKSGSN